MSEEIFVIASFDNYNQRRYSKPWVGTIKDGKYDFSNVGYYTGNHEKGEGGDIILTDISEDVIYAWGQKDYRGKNSQIKYGRIVNGIMVPCDKAGRGGNN